MPNNHLGNRTATLLRLSGALAAVIGSGATCWGQVRVQVLARGLDPAPGLPGVMLDNSRWGGATVSESGRVVFHTMLAGPGIDPATNGSAIWSWIDGSVTLLVRSGAPAANMPSTSIGLAFATTPFATTQGAALRLPIELWTVQQGQPLLAASRGMAIDPSGIETFDRFGPTAIAPNGRQVWSAFHGPISGIGNSLWLADRQRWATHTHAERIVARVDWWRRRRWPCFVLWHGRNQL